MSSKLEILNCNKNSVAAPSFLITGLVPEGTFANTPIPEGIPKVAPPLQRTVEEGTSSHPATTKEEEEYVVEVIGSKDKFDVFDQILSPEAFPGVLGSPSSAQSNPRHESTDTFSDMGIQRR